MATSIAHTCCICEEVYNLEDQKPLLLPCCHTFCRSCLQQLKADNNERCPLCRERWEGPVDSLPFIRQLADSFDKIKCKIQSATAENLCDHDDTRAWCEDCKVPSCMKCLKTDHRLCKWVSIEEKTNELVDKLQASVASTEMRKVENDLMLSEIGDNIQQMQHNKMILRSFAIKLSIQQKKTKSELEKYKNIKFNSSATELLKALSATFTFLDESTRAPKIPNFVVPGCEEPAAANDSEDDLDGGVVRTLTSFYCL